MSRSLLRRGCALVLVLLPSLAHAVPSQLATTLDAGAGTPTAVASSDDGLLVGVAGSSGIAVYDLRAPSDAPQLSDSCTDSGAEAVLYLNEGSYGERFYVACSGGGVEYLEVDRSEVPAGLSSSDKIVVNQGAGEALGLAFAAGDSAVFALIQDSTTYSIDRIPLSATGGDSELLGLALTGTATAISVASSGTPLVVARSDGYVSEFARSGEVYSTPSTVPLFALGNLGDVLASSELAAVFAADATNGEVWGIATGLTTAVEWGSGFSSPVAVAQGTDGSAALLWVAEQGGVLSAWDATEALQTDIDTGVTGLVDLSLPSDSADEAYAVASDGSLLIVHDRPVLSDLLATPDVVLEGESFTLSFGATVSGSWDVRAGGDADSTSGTSVATGSLEADSTASVELTASDLSAEGENRLFVFLDDGAEVGWDSVVVTLDTPPDAISTPEVGIGDERLYLSWTTSDESDIATYEVYLSEEEFDEDSLPAYSLSDEDGGVTEFPVSVTAEGASTTQTYDIGGLTNDVTYFLALRAVDDGGLVGPLSDVVSGAPAATCGAAECAGDPGCSCSQLPQDEAARRGVGLLLLVLLLLVAPARRPS